MLSSSATGDDEIWPDRDRFDVSLRSTPDHFAIGW
jgi:hypothetical protein